MHGLFVNCLRVFKSTTIYARLSSYGLVVRKYYTYYSGHFSTENRYFPSKRLRPDRRIVRAHDVARPYYGDIIHNDVLEGVKSTTFHFESRCLSSDVCIKILYKRRWVRDSFDCNIMRIYAYFRLNTYIYSHSSYIRIYYVYVCIYTCIHRQVLFFAPPEMVESKTHPSKAAKFLYSFVAYILKPGAI